MPRRDHPRSSPASPCEDVLKNLSLEAIQLCDRDGELALLSGLAVRAGAKTPPPPPAFCAAGYGPPPPPSRCSPSLQFAANKRNFFRGRGGLSWRGSVCLPGEEETAAARWPLPCRARLCCCGFQELQGGEAAARSRGPFWTRYDSPGCAQAAGAELGLAGEILAMLPSGEAQAPTADQPLCSALVGGVDVCLGGGDSRGDKT